MLSRSEQEFVGGELRPRKGAVITRGLNTNYNRRLKEALKGAAETASRRAAFKEVYAAMLAKGIRPEPAKVTLARKIATRLSPERALPQALLQACRAVAPFTVCP